ncbi:hypothetical protein BSL82_04195 [Tardibacter chloracetimidivorans]|uniref:Uncharacterized protein n=1 Tax=Tardibacter chloracetimidivorans TaxID=1921510 RepID=A0A1L3ZSJ8_9SPHN|nr:hypothetical protein [Tardibacter chloracetimidivorans]API58611.1 hypothetical protein BSL82_04195 [Tardibacter chloracetimidivorans]
MSRVADDILTTHLEVALATSPAALLDGLADNDGRRRHAAIGEIARQLVDRLRCFEFRCVDSERWPQDHLSLFPEDLGPISGRRP